MATKKPGKSSPTDCLGETCQWSTPANPTGGQGNPICEPGNGGCSPATLLEANESGFHDQQLVEATRKIKRVLAKIPPDPAGRKLSFCHTKMGTVLAWVQHGGKAKGKRVTANDDDATVAKALGLKGVPAGGGK
ncbi:MAG TPA: hypothetical protein VMS31_10060 [Pyrinomonadaceae bacterium]|nr:hypothetical protein [Pyrinomonadaceae bacterium]